MKLCVFAGPSLPQEDRVAADGVTYARPASRGDLTRAAESYDAVLLIDGVFHHDLAPSPKEAYETCRHIRLYGAASIGALRAAECARYGAVPLGAIAKWYECETIDGDDEVAVLVDTATQRALTVPSVNVRYVARLARRRNILSDLEAANLIERSRNIFYAERSWHDVIEGAPERARAQVADLARRHGDLKRHDARFALRTVLCRLGFGNRELPRRAGV